MAPVCTLRRRCGRKRERKYACSVCVHVSPHDTSQARVTTVICNNSVYQILKIEQQKQNLSQTGTEAKNLTDLGSPAIDWVSLAKGYGVESARYVPACCSPCRLWHFLA